MRFELGQRVIDVLRGKKREQNHQSQKPVVTYKNVAEILKNNDRIKLHIGCGTVYKEGWINIDNNSDYNIKKLDFMWDLSKALPFPENSVDFIYNEHFLEHLSVEQGGGLLKEFMRVLKPNAVVRIAMPDLEKVVKNYLNKNYLAENQVWLKKYGLDFIKTNAESINIDFRWWGHQWLYDWEELERRLREAGFVKIKKCKLNESEYPELQNLETRGEASGLIAEVVK